jgi:hypothetical protein
MTETSSRCSRFVMPGLDPGIHRKNVSFSAMDCRVKPGNDSGWVSANNRGYRKWQHGESND